MTTIIVNNGSDTPVDGETNIRQAIAEAQNGDVIRLDASATTSTLLEIPAKTITIESDTADGRLASIGSLGNGTQFSLKVDAGADVTFKGIQIINNGQQAVTGQRGSDGAAGTNGTPGQDGAYGTGQPGTHGEDGTDGGSGTDGASFIGYAPPALDNFGTVRLVDSSVVGTSAAGASGGGGGDGGEAGSGGDGGSAGGAIGTQVSGGNGADGGIGGQGGAGGRGGDGADAVGGIYNHGTLVIQDSAVSGNAQAGDGGDGGKGANGGNGGNGGAGGGANLDDTGQVRGVPGNGGNGGNAGDGGAGGDGGNGGTAYGGIRNEGSVSVVGAGILHDDSAAAGSGGQGGEGGTGSTTPGGGGIAGHDPELDTDGSAGRDGTEGEDGATGADGNVGGAVADISGGSSSGLTIGGKLFSFTDSPGSETLTSTTGAVTSRYYVYYAGSQSSTNSVGWRVVTGADGPSLSDFTSPTSGTLTAQTRSGFDSISLSLEGDNATPRNEQFEIELFDPSTGTLIGSMPTITQIVDNTAGTAICFASGTAIGTTIGEVAVERLAVGDIVLTASGAHRSIRWIGRRTIDCRRHKRPSDVMPVRISAHAFGDGLPARDLRLSPGHPVLVGADDGAGGHLVPIMCLINGTTIRREPVDEVTYWHVELEVHDILLAEGLPCESYIDLGSRPWFEGEDGVLYDPDLVMAGLPGRCRPVATGGPVVEAARRRLAAVFAMRVAAPCAWPSAGAVAMV